MGHISTSWASASGHGKCRHPCSSVECTAVDPRFNAIMSNYSDVLPYFAINLHARQVFMSLRASLCRILASNEDDERE